MKSDRCYLGHIADSIAAIENYMTGGRPALFEGRGRAYWPNSLLSAGGPLRRFAPRLVQPRRSDMNCAAAASAAPLGLSGILAQASI